MALKSSLLLAPLLFAVACSNSMGPNDGTDTDPNEPDAPPVSQIAGNYEVTSAYDLRLSPDLPAAVADALGPLSGLADNPAGTLIDVLKNSNSDIANLLDSLPGGLQQLAEAQINNYIQDKLFQDAPVAEQIVQYVDMIAEMLTNFEVITNLELGNADAAGNVNANHTLTAVAFPMDGARTVVPTPDILNTLSIARDVSVHVDLGARSMVFGDHAFQLPLGDFAVTAFHQALSSQFGVTDLGATLNEMIDCPGLAAQVGDICISGFCLVSEPQIADFCVQGLNKAADQLDEQIRKLEYAQLHMVGGEASLQMSSSSLGSFTGNWDAEFGINGGGFSLPSAFKATRK